MTEVTAAELDDAGRFGEWPVDFVEVELEAEGTYIDAVSQHAFGNLAMQSEEKVKCRKK